MITSIKIGSRSSRLAKIQVEEVLSLIGGLRCPYGLITLNTQGDLDKTTSLTTNPADNFFTDALDEALLKKQIDIAIHSAKDLPQRLNEGLKIFALTKPLDKTDSWVSTYSIEDLPQGAKIGTSSPLRSEMIRILRPDVMLVDIRGTIDERLDLLKNKYVDGLIIATCALKRLGYENQINSILPWETVPLQGQLAVVGRSEDFEFEKMFEDIDVRRHYGQVFLVGAGPGDPKLITVKAIEALKDADSVFYDYLVDSSLLQYASKAEHIYVGKRKGNHSLPQEKLSRQLKDKAIEGKNVVRLKGGDPFIFGRGAEEINFLRSYHISTQIIPGVSSGTGIPSVLGIPLTARGIASSVAFISAYGELEDGQTSKEIPIPQADTIVFFMGLTRLALIVQSLLKAGWPKTKPIVIVSNGTKPNQRVIQGDLSNIEKLAFSHSLSAPSLIIVGDTVNSYRKENPKVFLHCGTHPERYTHFGQIIPWPMIQIEAISLNDQQKEALVRDFDQSDFVILTSPAGAQHFLQTILALKPVNLVLQKNFIVIGKQTAEILEEFGIGAQIISAEETAEDLFNVIVNAINLDGLTILFPRSSLPNPFLKQALEQRGADVKEWTIYTNVKPPKRPLPDVSIDGVIFTSPSTFMNFLEDYGSLSPQWQILAKGPVTAKSIEEAGYRPHMVGL